MWTALSWTSHIVILELSNYNIAWTNVPFSQDCDDAFQRSSASKSSKVIYIYIYIYIYLNECTFITQYFVLYYLCIKLQKKKKLVNANARVFLSKKKKKKKFVVLSHSLLSKLTQLWRLPLLRNPEMWKRSNKQC